ncbi:MAG TPA: YcxB family protein [Candidatus Ornithomonoglobus intestinigallinarum]|uniref:YcxB family protein n=1 Tax=Candidatus Ornithomonoglobus intestinigallinarum TaxID=2840894 RepID=A0A9D1KNE1_9FIRM|nr:YcxB family protein [Candidatus Ornithomonoglobus intestinigallinarum]
MEKPLKITSRMADAEFMDFFKLYYREKFKTARIVMFAAAALAAVTALYAYIVRYNIVTALVCLWLAVFLAVYPQRMYRKPYKSVRGKMMTSKFTFDNGGFTEKSGKASVEKKYSEIIKAVETGKYFVFFLEGQSASVVCKKFMSESDAETIRGLVKANTKYKRVK